LKNFFKDIHSKFYSNYDISFMTYFLELTEHEGKFIVHHEKLIEYGIVTSNRSFHVKEKLDALELVENEDYHLPDVRQMVRPQGGGKRNNVYRRGAPSPKATADSRSFQKVPYESSKTT
jgi:hypothetical protein